MKTLRALLPLLRRHRLALLAVVMLGLAASLSEGVGISLFLPFLQSIDPAGAQQGGLASNRILAGIDGLFAGYSRETRLWLIPVCIFGSIVVRNALLYSNTLVFSLVNWRICHQLRCGLFRQLLRIGCEFIERRKTGNLLHTLNGQTWQTSQALGAFAGLITSACTIVVLTALLLLISWKLTLLVAAAMVLVSCVVQWTTRGIRAAGAAAAAANGAFVQQAVEGLSGMKAIRSFCREDHEFRRFESVSNHARAAFMKLDWISGGVYPLSEILSTAVLVGIVMLAMHERSSLPLLMTFIFMLYRLQPKLRLFDSTRAGLSAQLCDVEEVLGLLSPDGKPYIRGGNLPFGGLKRAIEFENVTFAYANSERPALSRVNIRIPRGQMTAIVGPSGAGKSTLIDLLCRFHDPGDGRIVIDGAPASELELKSWRESIAVLNQDAFIFNSTIRENIAFGKLDASDEEIVDAARKANAHGFIQDLPHGYCTHVGDRGVRLSGGQRQRIALARAMIRDAGIVILDEATNALDSIAERLIQDALESFGRDRTMIVIAHRLSTIAQADQIIVLNDGRVVEQGSLAEVLRADGLFAQMYRLQQGRTLASLPTLRE
jgi:subfamily B ATP-binding cassette protein MsbA